jgi:protein-disulfide isomerase
MANEKLTHKQEIANRRAQAASILESKKKKDKQRKIAAWSTVGVVVVAIATAIIFAVTSTAQSKLSVSETSPAALSSNGVILTSKTDVVKGTGYDLESGKGVESKTLLKDSKVPHIELYIDYDCPHCKEFEDTNAKFIDSLLEEKKATVEYKPIVVIGSNLSISGGNAAACVAEYAPNRFNDINTALFEQHGKQNVSVTRTVKSLGIEGDSGKQVNDCVSSKVFSKWLEKATGQALERKDDQGQQMVTGTPTVIIDGVKYPYAPDQFQAFMTNMIASGKTVSESIKDADASTAK